MEEKIPKEVFYNLTKEKQEKIIFVFKEAFKAKPFQKVNVKEIVEKAGAKTVGVGILVEKSFQNGRKLLEQKNVNICSLCRIASLENNEVKFNVADDEIKKG